MKEQLSHLMSKSNELAISFFAIIGAFLAPISSILLLVGASIMLDTIFGVYRAKKAKEKITSRKLSQVISKMLLYQLTIVLIFCLDVKLLGELVKIFIELNYFITKVTAMTLISIELTSINESFKAIYGFSLWEQFKLLVRRGGETKKEIEDTFK